MRTIISLVLLLFAGGVACAQVAGNRVGAPDRRGAALETISVVPWRYMQGTGGAAKTAREFLASLLAKARIDEVSEARTRAEWESANGEPWGDDGKKTNLPTPAQMLRAGRKLAVDWVMAGRATWHTRSIWVSLGPKTKSTCTVDVRIVDVKNQVVALDARDVAMDDTAKEDALKAVGDFVVWGGITVVSGGPKTPHEQRAAQLAIAKALGPWLAQHARAVKIDENAR